MFKEKKKNKVKTFLTNGVSWTLCEGNRLNDHFLLSRGQRGMIFNFFEDILTINEFVIFIKRNEELLSLI